MSWNSSIEQTTYSGLKLGDIFVASLSNSKGVINKSYCIKCSNKGFGECYVILISSVYPNVQTDQQTPPLLYQSNTLYNRPVLNVSSEISYRPDFSIESIFTGENFDSMPIGVLFVVEKSYWLCAGHPGDAGRKHFVNINTGEAVETLDGSDKSILFSKWSLVEKAGTFLETTLHDITSNLP